MSDDEEIDLTAVPPLVDVTHAHVITLTAFNLHVIGTTLADEITCIEYLIEHRLYRTERGDQAGRNCLGPLYECLEKIAANDPVREKMLARGRERAESRYRNATPRES